ncbi:hypothetical protein T12_13101, partial [Trichinella patagoniensis]
LVVKRSKCGSNEWPNPEDPLVIPSVSPVVDNGSSEAPGWVDASPSDGDCGQVNKEYSKPNWKRCKDRNMRISCISLGISSREDCVNEDKGADNLSSKPVALSVSRAHNVGASIIGHVKAPLEALDNAGTTYGA